MLKDPVVVNVWISILWNLNDPIYIKNDQIRDPESGNLIDIESNLAADLLRFKFGEFRVEVPDDA
jgi:hypothetical protein